MIRTIHAFLFILIFCCALSAQVNHNDCVRIKEAWPNQDRVVLRNQGSRSLDLSEYRLASKTRVEPIRGQEINSGMMKNIGPGESIEILWELDDAASDLALLKPRDMDSGPLAIIDFMQYGSAGHGDLEYAAALAGIWEIGEYISAAVQHVRTADNCHEHELADWGVVTIEEFDVSDLSVLPNPFRGRIRISHRSPNPHQLKMVLFDITGTKILEQEAIIDAQHPVHVNVEGQRRGCYLLELRSGASIRTLRLLKE